MVGHSIVTRTPLLRTCTRIGRSNGAVRPGAVTATGKNAGPLEEVIATAVFCQFCPQTLGSPSLPTVPN